MSIDENNIWHPYATIPNKVPTYLVDTADGVYLNFKKWLSCYRWYELMVVNDSWLQ